MVLSMLEKRLAGKRIFVSGGAGVIGRQLVSQLCHMGCHVFVGDLVPRPAEFPESVVYRQGDLNYITRSELVAFSPEIFFHLAATFERSVETEEFWYETYQHNVNLSNHLMTILKNIDSLRRVVFASSYLIYNPELYSFSEYPAAPVRLGEDTAILPRNLCGMAKLLHEFELRFLSEFQSDQFTSISARIYRSYGKFSRDIISRWIRALLNKETLEVYRKEGRFDYIYAGDVAEGLNRLSVIDAQGIVNLGNDNARHVSEVLDVLKENFPDMQYREVESDIPFEASQANMEKFKELTGWSPQRQIEDVIPELIAHEKNKKRDSHNEAGSVGNVLVTSISKKTPMIKAVVSASKKLGDNIIVHGADVDGNCIARHFVDKFWQMPNMNQLLIEEVIDYCKQDDINAIIPSRDGELAYWSSNKKLLLENGIVVMVSSEDAVNICFDKYLFSQFCNDKKLPAIPSFRSLNENTIVDIWVVKEQYGAGSVSIGTNLSTGDARKYAEALEQPIFQPMIDGREVSIDVYTDNKGRVKGAICRSRDLVVNGESQITTSFESPALATLCGNIAEAIGLIGHAVFQVFIDDNNDFHVIECNCRFGGASTLSIACGLDSFYWFLLEANKVDIEAYPFIPSEKPLKQIRAASDRIE